MLRSIRWRLAASYTALILVATLGLTLYISNQVQAAHLEDLEAQLFAEARLLKDLAEPLLGGPQDADQLDGLAHR